MMLAGFDQVLAAGIVVKVGSRCECVLSSVRLSQHANGIFMNALFSLRKDCITLSGSQNILCVVVLSLEVIPALFACCIQSFSSARL